MDTTGTEIAGIGLRWLHLIGGILWFGLGFFMNFVHLPTMPLWDPPTRKRIVLGMLPRVLQFMMGGAVVSVASGLILEQVQPQQNPAARSWLTLGSILGFIIFSIGILITSLLVLKVMKAVRVGQPPAPMVLKILAVGSKLNAFLGVPLIFGMLAGAGHFQRALLPAGIVVCLVGWTCVWLLFWKSKKVSIEV